MSGPQALAKFRTAARAWLARHADPRSADGRPARAWGEGSDSVAVFPTVAPAEERRRCEAASAWQRLKYDAGYGAITWPEEFGGRGLPAAYDRAFRAEERRFATPEPGELFSVTIGLVAPTIRVHGSKSLQRRFIPPLLRTDVLACQLFSEPGRDPTSHRCPAGPNGTATAGSSTDRRCGRPAPRSPTTARPSAGPTHGGQAPRHDRVPGAARRPGSGGAAHPADDRGCVVQRGLPLRRPDR